MKSLVAASLLSFALLTGPVLAAGESQPAADTAAVDPWVAKWGDLGDPYKAAKTMAEDGKYAEAIAAMNALNKPEDPRVLNWLGFSHRKMGKVEEALAFYDKALTLAPEFTPAHEYRGEAYLQKKEIDKAKGELAEIEKLCGNQTCEEYVDLKASIDKAATGG